MKPVKISKNVIALSTHICYNEIEAAKEGGHVVPDQGEQFGVRVARGNMPPVGAALESSIRPWRSQSDLETQRVSNLAAT